MSDFAFDRLKAVQAELNKQIAAIQNNDTLKDEAKPVMMAEIRRQAYTKLREELQAHRNKRVAEAQAEVAAFERRLAELNKEPEDEKGLLQGIYQMLAQERLSKAALAEAAAAISPEGYIHTLRTIRGPKQKLAVAENGGQIAEILKAKGASQQYLSTFSGIQVEWLQQAREELTPEPERKLRQQLKDAQQKLSKSGGSVSSWA